MEEPNRISSEETIYILKEPPEGLPGFPYAEKGRKSARLLFKCHSY